MGSRAGVHGLAGGRAWARGRALQAAGRAGARHAPSAADEQADAHSGFRASGRRMGARRRWVGAHRRAVGARGAAGWARLCTPRCQLGQFWCSCTWLGFQPGFSTWYFPESLNEHCSL